MENTQNADQIRKTNAKPGLIEVIYGEYPRPTTDGGRGYAYSCPHPVILGSIVQTPPNRLCPEPQNATVVSTYSDYSGPTATILEVIKL